MSNTPSTELAPILNAASEVDFEMATTSGSLMLAGGAAFAHIQRVAKLFASSDLIPETFRGKTANCTIALEMAHRMGANPMAVMQNLYIVHGRPGWSAQFIIACLNQCGKFSPIRFDISGEGDKRTCVAWATELATKDRLEGPAVSIQMAKDEGWLGKTGSKWKTMPDLMLRYRAATFFGRLYAPDLLMGMQTVEEVMDSDIRITTGREIKEAVIPAPLPLPSSAKPKALRSPKAADAGPTTEGDLISDDPRKSIADIVKDKLEASALQWSDVKQWVEDNGGIAADNINETSETVLALVSENFHLIQAL